MKTFALTTMLALSFALCPGAASAQTNTYVSNTGSDANNCFSAGAACASMQRAHNQTANGGTITCLNSDFYGCPWRIRKSSHKCVGAGVL